MDRNLPWIIGLFNSAVNVGRILPLSHRTWSYNFKDVIQNIVKDWKSTSSSRNNNASSLEEKEVVVGNIDGPHEALRWVIYWFLLKFADEKVLVTDGPTLL